MKDIIRLGLGLFTGIIIFKSIRSVDKFNNKKYKNKLLKKRRKIKKKRKKKFRKKKNKKVRWKDQYGMNLEEIKFI